MYIDDQRLPRIHHKVAPASDSNLTLVHMHAQYVTESFNSSSLFHKALKEAFEAFCNKQVGGLASAELMANFCNTLLTKAGASRFHSSLFLCSLSFRTKAHS